jgi:hypothetical protein
MKETVALTPVNFSRKETLYGWNNNTTTETGYSATLLEFSAPLGTAPDATNQAANTKYDAATKIKLNGKTVNEWHQEDGQTTVSYAHGGKYLHIRIPVDYLALTTEEYPLLTLTIEAGTAFMNAELSAVKLVFNTTTQLWEEPLEYGTPTVPEAENAYVGCWGWNHQTTNPAVVKSADYGYTIIGSWAITASAENLAATDTLTSRSITLNGKSFYELYQADDGYRLNSQLGYFGFSVPTAALVATEGYEYPTIEIVNGTPFYAGNYLPETEIVYKDGAWQLKPEDVILPDPLPFNNIAYGWNCMQNGAYVDTILEFGKYGVDYLGDQPDATNFAKIAKTILQN